MMPFLELCSRARCINTYISAYLSVLHLEAPTTEKADMDSSSREKRAILAYLAPKTISQPPSQNDMQLMQHEKGVGRREGGSRVKV